ncbi:MAG: dTDP-4-dehydrorhamnose reductase [Anaerolineae bacterium]|nr:dTDP-4-dehydrorhamnose reductase [Anaerolineae bacterium]
MRILITGARGRLGSALIAQLANNNHTITGIDIQELDVTDFAATLSLVKEIAPELVIHSAAWTDVDGCAKEPDRAIIQNGFGAGHIAQAAESVNARVIYISSNEVFDGRQNLPYREYDLTNPINPYGYSKWVGEKMVREATPRYQIVRTSWLFAHGGKNFIQSILNAANEGKPLKVVTDEVANPTYNDDLAAALVRLIETERFGIYHLVNQGYCSRYDFARFILDHTGYNGVEIQPISLSDWARPSSPPPFSPLENLAGKTVGIPLRPWQDAVIAFLEREGLLRA